MMSVRLVVAGLAMLVTGGQSLFLLFRGEGICFNDGCAVVESMTTVPPLLFNIAGFFFFSAVFYCLYAGRRDREMQGLAQLLLLAGLAAEAVLVFFQYRVAEVFCSYCLIILTLILLLNCLCGKLQIFRGLVLFAAVFVACSSLQFRGGGGQGGLGAGTLAYYPGEPQRPALTLFFSKTCPHCEELIASLDETLLCSLAFNPIDQVPDFTFAGAELAMSYRPENNLSLLTGLGINEIPVLLAKEGESLVIRKGTLEISAYLEEHCYAELAADEGSAGMSVVPADGYSLYLPGAAEEGNCQVETDCEEEQEGSPATQQ